VWVVAMLVVGFALADLVTKNLTKEELLISGSYNTLKEILKPKFHLA